MSETGRSAGSGESLESSSKSARPVCWLAEGRKLEPEDTEAAEADGDQYMCCDQSGGTKLKCAKCAMGQAGPGAGGTVRAKQNLYVQLRSQNGCIKSG